MTRQVWINLPVKDVARSKEFFSKLGFMFNPIQNSGESACMLLGDKKVVVMLFASDTFAGFTRHEVTDTTLSTEVLISIDAESKAEVEEMAQRALAAGGTVYGEPGGTDWMYGCGFADLDGHRWNVLYMDMTRMPQQ
jgi:predicted lactoylglutathione lyase